MTGVVEIRCPDCGSVEEVRKLALGTYRCDACETEFEVEDVRPE